LQISTSIGSLKKSSRKKENIFISHHFILQVGLSTGRCFPVKGNAEQDLKLSLLPETVPLYSHYFQFFQQLSLV